ncbi:hypothetical protein [Phytohabitans suffuscus]|uniref:Uncharacterized protein n=1 Tax=Phytohabitans suffuscus TaxID=624315 RepID=A0A6F8YFJ2_9ACTN|nr:hypothetical protein Psuf_021790 [Phytohabitans suffuscus]
MRVSPGHVGTVYQAWPATRAGPPLARRPSCRRDRDAAILWRVQRPLYLLHEWGWTGTSAPRSVVQSIALFTVVKLVGASYLAYLGIQAIR